jgi:hypothetical protein
MSASEPTDIQPWNKEIQYALLCCTIMIRMSSSRFTCHPDKLIKTEERLQK